MLQAKITSDCTCTIYDEETGDSKKNEYGYDERPEYCDGDCFIDAVRDLNDNVLSEWLSAKKADEDSYVLLHSDAMLWNRVSGWVIAKATGEHIVKALSLNGDFTLRVKVDNNDMTVVRSSHDEPTGASFTVTLLRPWELERAREEYGINVVE